MKYIKCVKQLFFSQNTAFLPLLLIALCAVCISCGGGGGGGGGAPVANPAKTDAEPSPTLVFATSEPLEPSILLPSPSPAPAVPRFREFMPVTTSVQVDNSRVFIDGRLISIKKLLVCTHEVTQNEFESVMGYNPSVFNDDADAGEVQGLRPVDGICWNEAIVYCNKRSLNEGFTPCYSLNGETNPDLWGGIPIENTNVSNRVQWLDIKCDFDANGYRLPKEVEWEYAARGGDLSGEQTEFSGCDIDELYDYAWVFENSNGKTHQVMLKEPNALGLYDMTGNVFEWVWDNYSYNVGITVDTPAEGPPNDEDNNNYRRRSRGGAWSCGLNGEIYHGALPPYPLYYCNNANSDCTSPWMRRTTKQNLTTGMRVVRTIE